MADLLCDIDSGQLKPVYNYLNDLPDMSSAHVPDPAGPRGRTGARASTRASMPAAAARSSAASAPSSTCRDASRAIARPTTSRPSSAPTPRRASTRFFITDDNFARNKQLGADPRPHHRAARAEGLHHPPARSRSIRCATAFPRFIDKCARAGCTTVYIGLENINPESLMGAKKRQNKIWEYREMLQAWRKAKVMIWAGYILGFPTDTPGIDPARHRDRQARAADRHPGVLLPDARCPARRITRILYTKGVPMDPDMNKYDLEHVCTAHPRMSKQDMGEGLSRRLGELLSDEHVETDPAPRLRQRLCT